MLHSEAMQILGMLAVKFEAQMQFKEREAIEYAISKLTAPAKDHPSALAQAIFESAQQASDMYNASVRHVQQRIDMSDNGTLRDHLADVIEERNELLRQVEELQKRLDIVMRQYGALWKVEDPK